MPPARGFLFGILFVRTRLRGRDFLAASGLPTDSPIQLL